MFNHRENLRSAILKKKARITEIERILSRPPVTEHRGRPVHGGQNWRFQLEEERQHLLIAVAELERDQEREDQTGRTPHGPELARRSAEGTMPEDLWRGLHDDFQALSNEERSIMRETGKDHVLRATCTYNEHPEVWETGKPEQGLFCLLQVPECGLWILSEGPNENFRARFEALGVRAAIALGSPKDTDLLDYWLHRLFLDLRENNSHELLAASEEGGMILHVCEASATFCSRVEKRALGTTTLAAEQEARRHKRLRATIDSPSAAKRMETYLESHGIGQTQFAVQVGTTDRTLRTFRKTGKVRRDIFESIAKAMGTTKEVLLKRE